MASSATRHFVMQRFTAMLQVPLVIWLVISVLRHARDSHAQFMTWMGEPLTAFLMVLFILSVFFHMHLGMDEIIEDYIHKPGTRSLLRLANRLFALVLGGVAFFSIIAITLIV